MNNKLIIGNEFKSKSIDVIGIKEEAIFLIKKDQPVPLKVKNSSTKT